jgi:hypothetical protein
MITDRDTGPDRSSGGRGADHDFEVEIRLMTDIGEAATVVFWA